VHSSKPWTSQSSTQPATHVRRSVRDVCLRFAAIERKMILTRCEERSDGRWRPVLGSGQSPSSMLTTVNDLGGCWRMANRSERSATDRQVARATW
jgi:hypothetical protein